MTGGGTVMEGQPRQGLSERLLQRYAASRGRGLGLRAEMAFSGLYAIAAAWLLIADVGRVAGIDGRSLAAALVLLGAFRGGLVGVLSGGAGVPTWQRALGAVVNLAAEGLVIGAAALWAREHERYAGPLAVGFLAFAGALLLGYARTRIRASAELELPDGPFGIAAREVRLLLLGAGLLLGGVYWCLVAIAAVTHAAVLGHLVRLRATLAG